MHLIPARNAIALFILTSTTFLSVPVTGSNPFGRTKSVSTAKDNAQKGGSLIQQRPQGVDVSSKTTGSRLSAFERSKTSSVALSSVQSTKSPLIQPPPQVKLDPGAMSKKSKRQSVRFLTPFTGGQPEIDDLQQQTLSPDRTAESSTTSDPQPTSLLTTGANTIQTTTTLNRKQGASSVGLSRPPSVMLSPDTPTAGQEEQKKKRGGLFGFFKRSKSTSHASSHVTKGAPNCGFGQALELQDDVPPILTAVIAEFRRRYQRRPDQTGPEFNHFQPGEAVYTVDGLFRESGMKGRIGEFKAQYDNNCKLRVEGKDIDALNGIDIQDAAILGEHELSGIFKLYLRNLAPVNPIFTLEQMAALKDMTKVTTKISAIHEAVNTFPKIRGKAVTLIFDFFREFLKSYRFTRMNPENVAIVLGPNLFKPPAEISEEFAFSESAKAITEVLLEAYIATCGTLFSGSLSVWSASGDCEPSDGDVELSSFHWEQILGLERMPGTTTTTTDVQPEATLQTVQDMESTTTSTVVPNRKQLKKSPTMAFLSPPESGRGGQRSESSSFTTDSDSRQLKKSATMILGSPSSSGQEDGSTTKLHKSRHRKSRKKIDVSAVSSGSSSTLGEVSNEAESHS